MFNKAAEAKRSAKRSKQDDDEGGADANIFGETYEFGEKAPDNNDGSDLIDGGNNKSRADFAPDVHSDVVNFHMDDQYLRRKWKRENIRTLINWVSKTLAILVGSIVFCFLGGYMFSSIELFNEVETCKTNREKYFRGRDNAREAILTTANNFQVTREERYTQYLQTLDTLISAFHNSSWSGDDCETMDPQWNFISSVFFCATVVTSIGYGYIAPSTFWGRCVLMAYAVIGIPMFLAAMANIGSFLVTLTHYVYHGFCCCGMCRETKVDAETRKSLRTQMIALWRTEPNAPSAHFLEAIEDDSGGDSSEEDAADEETQLDPVPIPASCLILVSVIIFGGSIFTWSEGWEFEDAIYFSFITVATIGFGDLVPGVDFNKGGKQTTSHFGLAWFFMIFGVAVLSTALQLMQENIESSLKKMFRHLSSNKKPAAGGQQAVDEKQAASSDSETDVELEATNAAGENTADENSREMVQPPDQFERYDIFNGRGNWSAKPAPYMLHGPGIKPVSAHDNFLSRSTESPIEIRPMSTFSQDGNYQPLQQNNLGSSALVRPMMSLRKNEHGRMESADHSGMFRPAPSAVSRRIHIRPQQPSALSQSSDRVDSAMSRPPSSVIVAPSSAMNYPSQSAASERLNSAMMQPPSAVMARPQPSAQYQQERERPESSVMIAPSRAMNQHPTQSALSQRPSASMYRPPPSVLLRGPDNRPDSGGMVAPSNEMYLPPPSAMPRSRERMDSALQVPLSAGMSRPPTSSQDATSRLDSAKREEIANSRNGGGKTESDEDGDDDDDEE